MRASSLVGGVGSKRIVLCSWIAPLALLGSAPMLGCTPLPEVSSTSEAIVACPGATTLEGIDVSSYQGAIDFEKVVQSGRVFVVARVADGMKADAKFATNWAAMKAAGLYRGAYQYFRAHLDPITQADQFLAALGPLGPGDLPPTLDAETVDGQTAAVAIEHMRQWLEHVAQKTGRTPIIYAAPSFWNQIGAPDFSAYPLWVANWKVTCPNTPTGWSTWSFWQSTDSGTVTGINGAVDVDHFNGSVAELDALAGGAPAPTPTPAPVLAVDGGEDGAGVGPIDTVAQLDGGTEDQAKIDPSPDPGSDPGPDPVRPTGCSTAPGAPARDGSAACALLVLILGLAVRRRA
jgi:lysozyme